MYNKNSIFHSDVCGSSPSYKDSNSKTVAETIQSVKVVESGNIIQNLLKYFIL